MGERKRLREKKVSGREKGRQESKKEENVAEIIKRGMTRGEEASGRDKERGRDKQREKRKSQEKSVEREKGGDTIPVGRSGRGVIVLCMVIQNKKGEWSNEYRHMKMIEKRRDREVNRWRTREAEQRGRECVPPILLWAQHPIPERPPSQYHHGYTNPPKVNV